MKPSIQLVQAAPLRYVFSLPRRTSPEGRLPVLCFLHGYDEGAPMETMAALTRHGPLRPTSSERVTEEFIVIAPQLPARGDIWSRFALAVQDIVTTVRATHGGDPARTYLTGFSFGGNGVLDLALLQPDYWAALWPVDPTRIPRADPGRPVWLSVGEASRARTPAFVRALRLRTGPEPEGDRVCFDEGADHTGSAALAYADDRIYSWLLSESL